MPNPSPPAGNPPKMGIWVSYDALVEAPAHEITDRWKKGKFYRAIFSVEEASRARDMTKHREFGQFITNPEIRTAIGRAGVESGKELGHMSLIRKDSRTMEWKTYFPFSISKKEGNQLRYLYHFFEHKGIAQLLELLVLQRIQKKFPTITRIRHEQFLGHPSFGLSDERVGQIRQRGTGFSYSMREAIDMLRWKIGRDTLQHRTKGFVETPEGKKALARVQKRDPYYFKNRLRVGIKRVIARTIGRTARVLKPKPIRMKHH